MDTYIDLLVEMFTLALKMFFPLSFIQKVQTDLIQLLMINTGRTEKSQTDDGLGLGQKILREKSFTKEFNDCTKHSFFFFLLHF